MVDSPMETVALGRGFELDCTFPSFEAVETTMRFRRRKLWHHRFDARSRLHEHHASLGLLRASLGFEADMFRGSLTWRFGLAWRPLPGRRWRDLVHSADRVLLEFDPCLGEVAGATATYPPEVDAAFGKSQTCTPTVLRIHVEDHHRDLCGVGRRVKGAMFPDHPPFVFNTVACVGAFPEGGPGLYTDPRSVWFNVFLGYYQLDCLKSLWTRPFGYQAAGGSGSEPVPEDLVRLGKSDWNWFSNWDYGVPEAALLPYSAVDMSEVGFVDHGLVAIGRSHWHDVELSDVEVGSCYVTDADQLVRNTIIDSMWRKGFGAPCPRPEWPASFIPTKVNARVYMAYWEDDASYHTVLFGGTAAVGADPAFLATQLAAARTVIDAHYPDLGFRDRG